MTHRQRALILLPLLSLSLFFLSWELQKDQGALPVRLYLLILTHDSLACPATGTTFSRAWPRNVRLSGCDGLPFRRGRSSASGGPGHPRPPGVFPFKTCGTPPR